MIALLNYILIFGLVLAFGGVVFFTIRWWNLRCVGPIPVHLFTFMAILFTSGLDVGLIMFPLTEFGGYAEEPVYAFANPLAIEFGFWGFLIWAFYFLTAFYFCVIEPRVQFFQIPAVKIVNNIVIIGTCAFTASLFLAYLPSYIPEIGDGETVLPIFYLIVFLVICMAAYSSTDLKFVRILSLGSTFLFFILIIGMWIVSGMGIGEFISTGSNIGAYFTNIHKFAFPLTDYHAFYLFWWFAWSIMIGQFTSRFVGGLRTWQLLLSLLILPSIPLGIWFTILYYYHLTDINTVGYINISMIFVGIVFVINSLDSLIRLYTDNLSLSVKRLGKLPYLALNVGVLFLLTLAFQSQWLQIQWIGTVVIGIFLCCLIYILLFKAREVYAIDSMPEGRDLDFHKMDTTH